MRRSLQLLLVVGTLLLASPLVGQAVPELPYDAVSDLSFLKFPDDIYLGEVPGVATNSRGHLFVYTRTGNPGVTIGTNRVFSLGSSRLFEFDQTGKFVRELGQNLHGSNFAHAVKVDAQDNVWIVDQGANMVVKLNPAGQVAMTMGRKPEALVVPAPPMESPEAYGAGPQTGGGVPGDSFRQPTDVAFDAAGNIFVADGHGAENARIAKFDKNGVYLKSWGHKGSGPGEFNFPHGIAVDARGNVYVADRNNKRIQVFDNDGNFKSQITNVGDSPTSLCITPGSHQYLYSSNSNLPTNMNGGEIYKLELDGKVVGKFGKAGRLVKEFGAVHGIDCRNENELYVGENMNWRVQKVTLRQNRASR